MAYKVQEKYHRIAYEGFDQWERIDRVQQYKDYRILSISYYNDAYINRPIKHRMYRVIYPNGHVLDFDINKRGGNIKELKQYLDFKERR